MFSVVIVYLQEIINVLVPCIFLRIVLDSFRNFIFKD